MQAGRHLKKWLAASSVVTLLTLGAAPAMADESAIDSGSAPVASSESTAPAPDTPVAPEAADAPASETAPADTAPASPPADATAADTSSTEGEASPSETSEPAAPEATAPVAPEAPAASSPAQASALATTELGDPQPPYLRWVVVAADDATSTPISEATSFVVQGPSTAAAPLAADETQWAGTSSSTVTDNTGQADYVGSDLDARPGYFLVKQLVDDLSLTTHDVAAAEQFRVRAVAAPSAYLSGDGAAWQSLVAASDATEATATVTLDTAPSVAALAADAPAELGAGAGDISILAAPVGAQAAGPYQSTSDWDPTSGWYWSGSAASGAEMNGFTSSAVKVGDDWVLGATWTRPVTGGQQGWVIEYTNAPEQWGKRFTSTPDSELVPRPDRSQGGTVVKIEPFTYATTICTYANASQYPHWNQTLPITRCTTVANAVTTTALPGGGERVTLSLKLPSVVTGNITDCTASFGSTGYIRSWTGNYNIQAWSAPIDFVEPVFCGSTTINVTKIGDRIGTDLTDGAPVAGATYSAYAATAGSNSVPTGPVLGTCVTNAAGQCSIVLLNEYPNGVWIQETATPAGWSNLPDLGIGNYNQSKTVTPYRFKVEIGTSTSDQTKNVTSDASRPSTTTSGAWVDMRDNPAFPQYCGVSIATVFDTSSSISESEMTSFKDAAELFVGSAGLGGTPSQLTMFQFNTTASTVNGGAVYDLSIPGSSALGTGYNGAIDAITNDLPSEGNGYTNWDSALQLVKSTGDYDLVLFLTDGDPTTYGDGSQMSLTVNFRGIEQAVMSANALKAEVGPSGASTKIVGIGVGLSNGSAGNLQAITGTTESEDYFLTGDFESLKQKLAEVAQLNCGSTLTIVKQLQNSQGEVISENTAGWTFTATGDVVNGSPATQTTTTSGTNFALTFNDANTHTVAVNETPQDGYEYVSTTCTNAAGAVTQTATGFTVPLTRGLITSCTVVNRELPTEATIELQKTWVVKDQSGETLATYYERGEATDPAVPAWLDADPLLNPNGGNASLVWGTSYEGFTEDDSVAPGEDISLDLSAHPGCMLTSQQLTEVNGTATTIAPSSSVDGVIMFPAQQLIAGDNLFGITNVVTCTTQLTLLKQVDLSQSPNSTLQPSDWNLTAAASGTPVLDGVSGSETPSAANTAVVSPDTDYQLTEASVNGQLAYTQLGIQRCATVTGFGATATCETWETGYITGDEISVDLGQHGIYRFVNQAIPPLTVPLTGGMGADLITIWGAGLLLLALLAGVIIEHRRTRQQWEVE